MATTTANDALDRPDASIRADLAAYFGPNAEHYLRVYDKMRRSSNNSATSWSWVGFFAPLAWLCYRKQYVFAAGLVAVVMAVSFVLDQDASGAIVSVIVAMQAKGWYVKKALARLAKADDLGLAGGERADYLRRAGGVSPVAGTLAGLVYVGVVAWLVWIIVNPTGTMHGDRGSMNATVSLAGDAPRR